MQSAPSGGGPHLHDEGEVRQERLGLQQRQAGGSHQVSKDGDVKAVLLAAGASGGCLVLPCVMPASSWGAVWGQGCCQGHLRKEQQCPRQSACCSSQQQ